ncbi:uncharacterized protein LOC103578710 [Microplitis demolitor]|uniref:uncharacterized protein LOC103578710 n=1 Tax=Microplitis demolitor TaxID=69319 RepID=UPI00235B6581|nr:uncharacterized protein LOC103578710 [Microplitis demolitor]
MRKHLIEILQKKIISSFPKTAHKQVLFRINPTILNDRNLNIIDECKFKPVSRENETNRRNIKSPKCDQFINSSVCNDIETDQNFDLEIKRKNYHNNSRLHEFELNNESLETINDLFVTKNLNLDMNISEPSSTRNKSIDKLSQVIINDKSTENNISSTNLRKRKVDMMRLNKAKPLKKRRKSKEHRSLPMLHEKYLNMVINGDQLQDDHIYQFKLILANCSDYDHRDTLYLARPEKIIPIPNLKTKTLNNFMVFLNQLFLNHSVDKLGHYHYCYESIGSCKSQLVCIELLSPHFPTVRYIKRLIYTMKETLNKVSNLDRALETADLQFLINIVNKMKEEGNLLDKEHNGLCLNEGTIQNEFKSAFIAFTKRSLELPRYKCISCQKLSFRKEVTDLSKLHNPISGEIWNDLIQFINEKDPTMNSNFICNYCLKKIRSKTIPPTCLLNNMYVGTIPNEIVALNEYEKLLIQRAKSFQVVQRLGTVAKKNLPHTMKIQKLKGQIFHLPLPIEETFKKICSTTDPINKNHELYIVIRSIPTKSNAIWENLVNLETVFKTLTWLKNNNPLYTEIKLPECPQKLREWLDTKNIEFIIDSTENTNEENNTNIQNDQNTEDNLSVEKIKVKIDMESKDHINESKNYETKIISLEENNITLEKVSEKNNQNNEYSYKKICTPVIKNEEMSGIELDIIQDHSYRKISLSVEKNKNINKEDFNITQDHSYSKISLSMDKNKNTNEIGFDKDVRKNAKSRAMVTQVLNPDGSQYEQYTIYPLHDKRMNESSTNMYQMLKINDKALDNRVKTLDLQCFPDLYPYGRNGQREDRKVPITDYEYIKTRLKSADPRFRLNQQYLFYLLNDANIRQLGQGIFHTLNVTNPRERHTAESYLKYLKSGQLEANLTTLFSRLRNSEQFWSKPRNNLHCMTRFYGPATWFFTVSPAEWLWDDLVQYVKEINAPHFDKLSPSQVIAADPVSVSRFIENKFQAVLDFILSDSQPLGKIIHYFWRREYQGRGIQHFHLILWVEGAPIIGINTNEEVVEFIMKYVTCKLPNKKISPTLHRRVTAHQQHHHNSYCLRTKKPKSGRAIKACRFGFPRPTTENFILRDAATSIAGRRNLNSKSRLYDLPRTENEVNINDYNPAVLSVWEGNMDIQFIGEKSTLLTQYVTKYATKKEVGKTSETVNEINSTKTLPQLLWNIAFRSLNHREIGALEAADTLLGISLYGTDSDTVIRWLDIRMIRNRKLKSKDEIELLEKVNPESTDIFCPSWIDDYYPSRPQELESLCLYDFARWYDLTKSEPKNSMTEYYEIRPSIYLKRRLRGYLINHYRYNVANQPENYFYSLLLLFQPWRDTEELKNGFNTYTESFKFQQHMLEQANLYHEYNEDFQKGLDYIKNVIEKKCHDDQAEDLKSTSADCDPAETNAIAKELNDAVQKQDENHTLADMINKMNVDQIRVFEKIKRGVLSNDTKIRLYVSGEGGTGKSFVINVIKRWIKEEMNQETVVTAPTGIAAFNINGLTVHRVFQLPVEHGFTPSYKQLPDSMLKVLRDQLQNVTLFIIDEISMISNITLIYIHLRLSEIFNVDDWFGGKHIVVFGDLLQLPPVHENPSYMTLSSTDAEKYIGSMSSVNIWSNLFSYEELTINMRQKTDKVYGELLSRVRVNSMTADDIKLLEQRKIIIDPSLSLSYNDRLHEICNYIAKLPMDTVCLVPTCKQCDLINSVMIDKIASEKIILEARDHIDCPKSLKKKAADSLSKIEADASQSAGLAKTIIIKIGAKVMLRRNIDVTLGLVNGAIGTVKSISKSIDTNGIENVNVDFGTGKEHVIERIKVKFQLLERAFVIREQFPLCLSYAVTIHKSQGLSLKNAIIEAGNSIFNVGQIYVALSRVTELNGLHLINFDPYSVKANLAAIQEYNRLKKTFRPNLPEILVSNKRWHKVWDLIWAVEEQFVETATTTLKKSSCKNLLAIRGIENSDKISGGFNSIVQCIFNNEKIILNSNDIKQWVFQQECPDLDTDPVSIFATICKSNPDIKNLVQYELLYTDRCKVCNYTNLHKKLEDVLRLPMINPKNILNLQRLIDSSFGQWFNTLKFCNNCKEIKETHTKIVINSVQQIIVVKLELSLKDNNKISIKKKGLIKSVPTAKISLCNKMYNVVSAIFYSEKDDSSCHYVAMIKDNSAWFQADDKNIQSLIGQEPAVLQKMTAGKTKVTAIINNVVSVKRTQQVVKVLQKSKFYAYVDETTDNTNDKWMTLMLLEEFINALAENNIPLDNLIRLACDNAPVMFGINNSFKKHLTKRFPHLLTLPCICHSLALIARDSCKAEIPGEVDEIISGFPNFVNGSPKRFAEFNVFQQAYEDDPLRLLRFAPTSWLSRQIAISRILDNWDAILGYLIEQALLNVATADKLLNVMNKPMTKAHLLFLKFVLDPLEEMNAKFQASKILVNQMQPSSKKLFIEELQRFMKPDLLDPLNFTAQKIDFRSIENHRDMSEVNVGTDCEDYLRCQLKSGIPESEINEVRSQCKKFFQTAAAQI